MSDHYTEHTLIIPLIGTKSSGSPLSHEEVAKYLISAFANYTRISERRLAKGLIVSIYDKDLESMKHIMEVKRHIDMECGMGNFSYLKVKSELTQFNNSYGFTLSIFLLIKQQIIGLKIQHTEINIVKILKYI